MAFISEKSAREAWAVLLSHDVGTEPRPFPPSESELKTAFKTAAMVTHPDRCGNAGDFVNVDRAKCILERYLAQPAPAVQSVEHKKKDCGYCQGKGHVTTSSGRPGAPGLRRTCPQCKGSGDADFDGHNP